MKKGATRSHTVPPHRTPHHLAHTRDTALRLHTQLRHDLRGGDHPLGDGLLDGQERLRAAARRPQVVERRGRSWTEPLEIRELRGTRPPPPPVHRGRGCASSPCYACVCVSLSRAQEQRFIHPSDSNFFWAVLFAAPIAWGILAFTALITFKVMWGLLTGAPAVALSGSSRRRSPPCRSPDHPDHGEPPSAGVAFMCNAINVVGYVKCKKDARKKLSALGGSVMLKGMEMWGSRKGASSSGA